MAKKTKIIFLLLSFFIVNLIMLRPLILQYFYYPYISVYSTKYQINPMLILAVIKEESSFHKQAISKVGAIGLMQIMPKTGKEIFSTLYGKHFSNDLLMIPEININIGIYYLKKLIVKYDGNLVLALSAYNAGIGVTNKWINNQKITEVGKFTLNDIPYNMTKIFVKKVIRDYKILQKLKFYF